MTAVSIAAETPRQHDVRALVAELDAFLDSFLGPDAPAEFHAHMTIDELAGADTTLLVARDEAGAAVGCAALRDRGDGSGEVKRMFVRPAVRGSGVGAALLGEIARLAEVRRLSALLLETGEMHSAARRLYERFGFVHRGAFPPYWDDPHSVFYELALPPRTR